MACNVTPEWLTAIGTIIAVIVALFIALFSEDIHRWRRRPFLTLGFAQEQSCLMPIIDTSTGKKLGRGWFHRLSVLNTGKEPARDVQVFINKLEKLTPSNSWEPVRAFIPIRLKWAHIEIPVMPFIPSGIQGICNLSSVFARSNDPRIRNFMHMEQVNDDQLIVKLYTEVDPTAPFDLLKPGKYRLSLAVVASNTDLVTKEIEIENTTGQSKDGTRKVPVTIISVSGRMYTEEHAELLHDEKPTKGPSYTSNV